MKSYLSLPLGYLRI